MNDSFAIDYHRSPLLPPLLPHLPMHSASPSKKRHDVWLWFIKEEARTGTNTAKHGKCRVFCARCLDEHIGLLRETDELLGNDRDDVERYKECTCVDYNRLRPQH